MKRRKFIQNSSLIAAPFLLNGQEIFAGAGVVSPKIAKMAAQAIKYDRTLVIVQLNGGNDGLNMVINLDNYSLIKSVRANVGLDETKALKLTDTVGLHPIMTGMQDLYNKGKLRIAQGVSYPNPNFSHFRAQDIFFSGSPSNKVWDTGWLGRSLDIAYPGFPENYPNAERLHPPAIQIGGTLPLCLQGENINMGYSVPSNVSLLTVLNPKPKSSYDNDYELELDFVRIMKEQSNAYTGEITKAFNAAPTKSTMYAASGNTLSDQLKTVARLIGGGLNTPIFIVNHPDSFDTHNNQVIDGSPNTGVHSSHLNKLSVAISAFMDDLTLMGKSEKVIGMTFSEFGRRVNQNASFGTDHGQGAPVFFFGDAVQPGVLGNSPALPTTIAANTQVPTQFDFRQLYSTILKEWFGFDQSNVSGPIFEANFANAVILKSQVPLANTAMNINAIWESNKAKITFEVTNNSAFKQYNLERTTNIKTNKWDLVGTKTRSFDGDVATYIFEDPKINASEIFYRVVALKENGESTISKVVFLENGNLQKISIFPNPIINFELNVDLLERFTGNVTIEILGNNGTKLYADQTNIINQQIIPFKVSDMFTSGRIYVVVVKFGYKTGLQKITFK